jgi:beta-glucanase (GH16 family)
VILFTANHRAALALLLAVPLVGAFAGATRGQTAQSAQVGKVVFFDDFSGTEVDRSKWNVIVTGRVVNNEQQAYVDSTETLALVNGAAGQGAENGALQITARYRAGFKSPEGRAFDFISGRLDTRDRVEFTYGTASARLKMTAGAGLWPAFWALGAGRWPDTGEIDIMENVGDPTWTNVALHGPGYSGDTPLVMRRAFMPRSDVTAWHVYSVEWTPDSLVFKVDGQTFYTVSKAMVEQHGRWAYDTPEHLIVNLALGGQYPPGGQSRRHALLGLARIDRGSDQGQQGHLPGGLGEGHGAAVITACAVAGLPSPTP